MFGSSPHFYIQHYNRLAIHREVNNILKELSDESINGMLVQHFDKILHQKLYDGENDLIHQTCAKDIYDALVRSLTERYDALYEPYIMQRIQGDYYTRRRIFQ